jgi:hypothetical protein
MSNNALQALQLRGFRGLPATIAQDPPDALERIASSFIGEGADAARVETRGDSAVARTFSAAPDRTRGTSLDATSAVLASGGLPPSNVVSVPVVYRWTDAEGREGESVRRGGQAPMAIGSGGIPVVEGHFIPATYGGQGAAAALFSELDKAGDATPFVEAVRAQFPEVEVVSFQLEAGQPLLHARLKGQRQQRPLELLSGGLARISVILLTISRPSTAVVMVDEIENGLQYQRFGLLWRQVREFATRADTQVFATTHSLECLDAAADAMAEHPDDFALLRAARSGGDCVVGLLPGLEARQLLRSGLEVRG